MIALYFLLVIRPVTIQKITPPRLLAIILELTAARSTILYSERESLIKVEFKTFERPTTIYDLCGSVAGSAVFK